MSTSGGVDIASVGKPLPDRPRRQQGGGCSEVQRPLQNHRPAGPRAGTHREGPVLPLCQGDFLLEAAEKAKEVRLEATWHPSEDARPRAIPGAMFPGQGALREAAFMGQDRPHAGGWGSMLTTEVAAVGTRASTQRRRWPPGSDEAAVPAGPENPDWRRKVANRLRHSGGHGLLPRDALQRGVLAFPTWATGRIAPSCGRPRLGIHLAPGGRGEPRGRRDHGSDAGRLRREDQVAPRGMLRGRGPQRRPTTRSSPSTPRRSRSSSPPRRRTVGW